MSGAVCVMALDLATQMGWALWRPGSAPVSGTRRIAPPGADLTIGEFLVAYEDWLWPVLRSNAVTHLVYEAPWVSGKTHQATALRLLNLAGTTHKLAERCRPQMRWVAAANNATVRAHFIGKGARGRAELKAATIRMCRMLGFAPADDNEADALAALSWAAHHCRLPCDWNAGALFGRRAA